MAESTAPEGRRAPVVTVFRSRLRPDVGDAYPEMSARMTALARSMPGFVDFKTFVADDGERVSVIVFDSEESHGRWRDHPDHRAAQETGRRRFYEHYDIRVCREVAHRTFDAT